VGEQKNLKVVGNSPGKSHRVGQLKGQRGWMEEAKPASREWGKTKDLMEKLRRLLGGGDVWQEIKIRYSLPDNDRKLSKEQ